jgi:hypothetical protein
MGIAHSHRRADGARRHSAAIARRSGVATFAAVLLAFACLNSVAYADTGEKIIERCTHGQSLSGFSQEAYRRALAELPTEVEEYSDCGNLIRRAQLAATGSHGGSGGSTEPELQTATPLKSKEESALKALPRTGALGRRIGGTLVRPGVVHPSVASAFSSLPAPLLAVLAFLLACALALVGRTIGRSVRARRSD